MVAMTLGTSALASLRSSPLGKMEELSSHYCIFCASFIEVGREGGTEALIVDMGVGREASPIASSSGCRLVRVPISA